MSIRVIFLLILTGCFDRAGAQNLPMFRYSVENMKAINSRFSELSIRPHTDTTYFLVSDRGGKNKYNNWIGGVPYDLFVVDRRDWRKIWPADGLNTKFSDGPVTFLTPDRLYVTQTSKRGQIDPATGNFIYRLTLAFAVYRNGVWEMSSMDDFSDKRHSYAHPAISTDGRMLFFSSDKPGGYGGKDLYVSYREGDQWSEPINLGPTVNSKRDEIFPFYHPSGRLYFSSNRPGGLGGIDVYVTRPSGRDWTVPENLGEPINSTANDQSIYFDAAMERGYFSSNRLGGSGGEDVYAIFVDRILPEPEPDVTAGIAKPAKESTGQDMTFTRDGSMEADPVAAGRKQVAEMEAVMRSDHLNNVYFDMGSSRLDNEAVILLDRMVELLNRYDRPVLELHAHADATGNYQQNVQLTEKRARSVMQYLIGQGIPLRRMSYRAYGESALIVDSDEEIRVNRRVEFRLKSFGPPSGPPPESGHSFSAKSLEMLDRGKFYVQVAALSATSLFKSYNLREYGAPICYFENGMYKYVLGPYDTYDDARKGLPHIRQEYNDAFIIRNE